MSHEVHLNDGVARPVKFLLKLALALAVGAVSVALVTRGIDLAATAQALTHVSARAVGIYLVLLAITHVFRSWRWAYLLRPLGVSLSGRALLSISSVGFMAIQALPVRLGEFVRPYFVVRTGQSRMSAVLGTVAVERIVDGLLISLIFFASYLASAPGTWSPELVVGAWVSLLGFVVALAFLAGALAFPDRAIDAALALTLLPRFAPALAHKIHDKLHALVRGFAVLRQPRNLLPFLFQSLLYWGVNGLGMWMLARSMGLDVSPVAAYAAMSFTGVLISLPNSPGLVGQFHLGVVAALAAYLPGDVATRSTALAYATLLHGIQFVWYTVVGFAALPFVPGGRGRDGLRQVVVESNRAALADDDAAVASGAKGGSGGGSSVTLPVTATTTAAPTRVVPSEVP